MKPGRILLILALSLAAVPASAQQHARASNDEPIYYEEEQQAESQSTAASAAYRVVYEQEPLNTRAGLAIGLSMPGFLTFQAFYQSFSAIVDGLYMDFRLTGSTFAPEVYASNNSPLFENSFETDFRVGFGTRNTAPRKATIRDSEGRRFQGRVPDSFGVAPYLGWRGRWGYDMQALRLGIHIERSIDAEVLFSDGRSGQSSQQWSYDFEIFYALRGDNKGQEGIGIATGFDYYFNKFLFTRGELGFAMPNSDLGPDYDDAGVNLGVYDKEVNAADGFFWKILLGFSYQFNIPNSADKRKARELARAEEPAEPQPEPRGRRSAPPEEEPPPAEPEPTSASVRECNRDADCDDGIFCNGEEVCVGGICMAGEIEDDGIACTQLICDEETRTIRFEPIHSLCGDGIFCNGIERCDVDQGCIAGNPPPVDDGNVCTRDYCDESMKKLVNEPIPGCDPDDPSTHPPDTGADR